MTNSNASQGIGRTCTGCSKSAREGAVFGLHKSKARFYEKPICKSCEASLAKERRQKHPDKIAAIKQKYHETHAGTIKHHVQEKIATWRKASCVPSDLTVDYLIDLYNQQDGQCFYSNEKMVFGWVDGKIHHNSLSLDKLDPAKGYVKGNVVWCSYLINTMKQDMTEQQFYTAINNIFQKTYGVPMINDISLKDKLRKLSMDAKIGTDLIKLLERECTDAAKKGEYKCRIYFSNDSGQKPFYSALGPANLNIWKEMNEPSVRFSMSVSDFDAKVLAFTQSVITDLSTITSLKITLLPQPIPVAGGPTINAENIAVYRFSEIVLDVTWL